MTEPKETARCPVCGEMHEVLRLWFNGASQIVIPCPKVDRDSPMFFPEPKKNEGE
jgi:hypothetical protein